MHALTTAPVTKSGDTMLGLAVCEGQLDIIKYLVTECSVNVNGEQSVYVSPATVVSVSTHSQWALLFSWMNYLLVKVWLPCFVVDERLVCTYNCTCVRACFWLHTTERIFSDAPYCGTAVLSVKTSCMVSSFALESLPLL